MTTSEAILERHSVLSYLDKPLSEESFSVSDDEIGVILKGNEHKWFIDGVNAAFLAPTAMNQQKYKFACHRERR